ncbi:MAG: PD-(D/E)XK nuclease family protein [Clostridia bacterium]|nr:PD-(D/E)XK nuclease family protein [Clostridia bacterium]
MLKDLRFTDYFLFTQHSLTTFDNCPLKFKKRYLENLKWDSFPDESIKRKLEMGNNFHLLANRYFMGIDTGLTRHTDGFEELHKWITSLKANFKMDSNAVYLPEYKLRMVTPQLKLEANFDLLVIRDGYIEVWDWKTHSGDDTKRGAESKRLRESLQTIVYLFVLKEQASLVLGKEIDSEKISMFYWQPYPARVLTQIRYSDAMHEAFREILEGKIRNILEYNFSHFDKEIYKKHCRFCEFNWFCNNESVDFKAIEEQDDFMDTLDWDSIEEQF